jgi:hypothetical protein
MKEKFVRIKKKHIQFFFFFFKRKFHNLGKILLFSIVSLES